MSRAVGTTAEIGAYLRGRLSDGLDRIAYFIIPRYIFAAIPSIFTTTAAIVGFPVRLVVTKTPEIWCSYVGIGCHRKNHEGEEVVRNATFATDLEVRNAFTVIHNLNYLNNSSNRLVLDSVFPSR